MLVACSQWGNGNYLYI